MEICIFYIPVAGENDGAVLGRKAIEAQLAACANIFPIQSLYPWEGRMQQDLESVLILKTLPGKAEALMAFVEAHHTYDTPCILRYTAVVNERYGVWMKSVLGMSSD